MKIELRRLGARIWEWRLVDGRKASAISARTYAHSGSAKRACIRCIENIGLTTDSSINVAALPAEVVK